MPKKKHPQPKTDKPLTKQEIWPLAAAVGIVLGIVIVEGFRYWWKSDGPALYLIPALLVVMLVYSAWENSKWGRKK